MIHQHQAVKQAYDAYAASLVRPTGLVGVPTGHMEWDMQIGGWQPRQITSLAMRSRHGKTAAVVQLAEAASKVYNGKRGELIFFSWELSAQAFVERYICYKVGITMMQYRYAKLLPQEVQVKIVEAYREARKMPIHYHQSSSDIETVIKTVDEKLTEIKRGHGTLNKEDIEGVTIQPIVVIDYVTMAKARPKSYGSKTYDIGDFLQTFKQYANGTGVSGLFLAQIRRDTEGEPVLSHIQDSGAIEQNSDNVILGYRPEADLVQEIRDPVTDSPISSKDNILWRFLKCRENEPRDILGHVDIKYNRFWPRTHRFGDDYQSQYSDEGFWREEYGLL